MSRQHIGIWDDANANIQLRKRFDVLRFWLWVLYGLAPIIACADVITTKINLTAGAVEINGFARYLFANFGFSNTVIIRFTCVTGLIAATQFLLWQVNKLHNASANKWFKIVMLLVWIILTAVGLLTVVNNLVVMGKLGILF